MQKQRITTGLLAAAIFMAGCLIPVRARAVTAPNGKVRESGDALTRFQEVTKPRRLIRRKPGFMSPSRPHTQVSREAQAPVAAGNSPAVEVALLKEQVAIQREQIDQLRTALDEQRALLERTIQSLQAGQPSQTSQAANLGQVASLRPIIPSGSAGTAIDASTSPLPVSAAPVPATQAEIQQYTSKVDELGKKMDGALKNLAGFKFSGDFRYRADVQARSGNKFAGPLQSLRSRYRLRFNIDKEVDPRFNFHLQLSTGPLNNGLTNDQDFGGTVAKHPFSIAEAYVDYHPHKSFSLRGGRLEEIFADNSRFLWDDDVRFNGFQQVVQLPMDSKVLGVKSVEFRAAEYILTNPNIVLLSSSSPFVSAGYQPGQKVRDANLFHPGVVVKGELGSRWSHQFISDIQIYRNPDQIQLSSVPAGFPVVVSNALGIALSGPMTGTGNATTTPGGAIYNAPNFQVVRMAYRLERQGWTLGRRAMPLWLDFQATRNTGASKLRDALMVSANVGSVKGFGDMRFLYQFAIKDANSLISQFTDDELGIGTGVNIATNAVRFDLGLTRFLQWQNLFFIQEPRRPSNPAEQFFVPLQRGANTTFRYLGQLAFSF